MTQTRIDQFYKVINSSKKHKNVKNNTKKPLNFKNSTISKQNTGLLSRKSKAFSICGKVNLNKINRKQIKYHGKISLNTERFHSSKIDVKYNLTKVMEVKTIKNIDQVRYTSKKSLVKNILDKSQTCAEMTQRKLFKNETDKLISAAIDNLNLAKEGAITNNDIDLEKIYLNGIFSHKYNSLNTTTSTKYDINDMIIPIETHSQDFFLVIATVFSKPINCGYFDKDELDLIFSLLTLSGHAQALLIRMLKRKQTWYRIKNIKYNEISDDLKPIFDELISRSVFKNSIEKEDISVLLNLLQVEEMRKLCQELKISSSGRKEDHIKSIMKFCTTTKSLFPGMQSPATKLRISVIKILGCCVFLSTKVRQIVDRIITLLMPTRDPTETLADIFLTISRVKTNQIQFPKVIISDFPVFANKRHLLDYIEAKNALFDALNAIEKKQWQIVRNLGSLAVQRLSLFLEIEIHSLKNSILPDHIRRFMPGYIWLKVLSKSVDAFKKTKQTMPQAIEFLHILIKQNCHMKNRKAKWYTELIKIEMYHRKNLDASVMLLSNAVSQENLTEVDKLDLLDRAEMLIKRKSGISQHAKDTVKIILENELGKARLTPGTSTTIIEGTLCGNTLQRKSTWCISTGIYGTVESLALYHYKCEGYLKGIHCEGAFPITLFGTLFWDEIYNMNIPGAYVSLYQDIPIDLFSSEFYKNRKEKIDMKLQEIRQLDPETLSERLKNEFNLYCKFKSICQGNIFDDSDSFQEIAYCLGVEGVIGICERLIHNFPLWRAGFPDLIVWNPCTRQYKIVEVKGPGDSLSTKQKLWLEYLHQLGLNTEVCYCEAFWLSILAIFIVHMLLFQYVLTFILTWFVS